MKTLAVIPARKGSKGIAGKNKAILDGIPLVSHTFDFIEDNKNEFTTCNGSCSGKIFFSIKYAPTPINRKDAIKYSAKKPVSIFKTMLFPNEAERTNCFHSIDRKNDIICFWFNFLVVV